MPRWNKLRAQVAELRTATARLREVIEAKDAQLAAAIRHPIYSGIILAIVGTAVAVSVWLIALVLLGAYFVYSAVSEERNMTRLFPDEYPDYKRSTRMLAPFIF
jgi:protein-S-isoprenylcysteine O-methyltransferase Ste14